MDYTKIHWHAGEYATDTPDTPGTENHAEVRSDSGRLVATVALHGTAKVDNEIARLLAAAPKLMVLLEHLTTIAETAAHMRRLENEILPTTDAARALIEEVKRTA